MSNIDNSLISKVFNEEQSAVLSDFLSEVRKSAEGDVEKAVADELSKRGISDDVFGLSPVEKTYLKINKTVKNVKRVWDSNGWVPGCRERITYDDLCKRDTERKNDWLKSNRMVDGVFSTDQPLIIPRVIEQTIRESIEPNIVLTNLLERINFSNAGTTITFPAVGDAMVAADIPEAGEYPEASLEFAGEVTAKIGKSGIAVKLTDEMIRYSMFDIMSMHMRAAGRALIRHKEQKVADLIFNNGVTFFDNTVAGKDTSGRNASGTQNDTITLDDLLLMYADLANSGFIPDTLLLHPFSWFGMAREPVMRAIFMAGYGGGQYYQTFQGTVGNAPGYAAGGLNNNTFLAPVGGAVGRADGPQQLATTFTVPGIMPTPMTVIVTPYQAVDVSNRTATITMCKRSELGMLLVDEDVVTEEFDDPARDIRKVKFRERYALALKNNGETIRHAKNVNWWNRGYAFDDLLTWQAGTGALPALSQASIDIIP
jgi:hypothetical protein